MRIYPKNRYSCAIAHGSPKHRKGDGVRLVIDHIPRLAEQVGTQSSAQKPQLRSPLTGRQKRGHRPGRGTSAAESAFLRGTAQLPRFKVG
jgi:hypothetical protein